MQEVYITQAKRTAVGSFLGGLSTVPAHMLGAEIIKAILQDSKLEPAIIDEVILGQVLTGGSGQNPARQSVIHAGMPITSPAMTINKVCGSGLKAVALAANAIRAGEGELIIAGGQENMSLAMHASYLRAGRKFGNVELIDMMMYDGLTDVFSGAMMGITAENIADKFKISREDQDQFALASHLKAAEAQRDGKFKNEIVPIEITVKKDKILFANDEGIRSDSTIAALAKLRSAFKSDGSVTAGNSSTINDGAAGVLVASEAAVKKYKLTPIARIVSHAQCGVEPSIMGTGPVPASQKALTKAGWTVSDLDIIEANEAFAVQAEYVNRQMKWDVNKVNINGGAIALGHPIGASGARVLVTLLHEMQRSKAKKALATLCIGGGMGIAMCLEGV
ncbi:MAG: acetyl-CoA C-acetyltransferase [Rickettsiaceae bacterium]|nr:acetyl-CoA C-acetyltransferase [Rickettsiaceae bacterium]MDP4832691.1 acetyl-CoA C-acetyltransferase [Rickettsiaceae bacterium]MDP5020904.1 acetyl-CoA C-acetyltransferase [Rickettsiaceae bacterium]MDP5083515.1 acetyl-CoA C-acetyltransferase [Rickettsiaceae bacterium]